MLLLMFMLSSLIKLIYLDKLCVERSRFCSATRFLYVTLFVLISTLIIPYVAYPQARVDESDYYNADLVPWSTAKSFIIYHVDTDRIVAALNPDYVGSVASLTKLMTCLLADELLDYDRQYRLAQDEAKLLKMTPPTSKKQSASADQSSGSEYLQSTPPIPEYTPPPEMTLNQLIDLAMVPSNNTVCKVIARLIDGDEGIFAERMTKRAAELGLKQTQYCNSTGLPSKLQQYSTTRDQLKLSLEIMNRPNLLATAAKQSIFHQEQWDSTLLYLKKRYPVYGLKTGWTNAAGRCMIILLEHPKYGKFIIVQMKSANIPQSFVDAEVILSRFGLIELTPDSLLNEARHQEEVRNQNRQTTSTTAGNTGTKTEVDD
jgi:D-alanyl-D-alanine carboxypeptidase